MSQQAEQLYRVVLSTGKVAYLREPLISDTETATAIAGKGAGDNHALIGVRLQKEMLKAILVMIETPVEGGNPIQKRPTLQEKEQLDKLITVPEYSQLIKVVNKLSGPGEGEAGNEPVIEFVAGGVK